MAGLPLTPTHTCRALCSDRLTITVRITAKEPGHRRTVWKQKYHVKKKPFILCRSRGTG